MKLFLKKALSTLLWWQSNIHELWNPSQVSNDRHITSCSSLSVSRDPFPHTSICHGEQVPHPNSSTLPLPLAGLIVPGTSPLQQPGAFLRLPPTPISIALDHPLPRDLSFSIVPGTSNEESNLYTFDLKLGDWKLIITGFNLGSN